MAYNMENDTIAAISTAVSSAGIGIIRISGADAVTVADRVYRSKGGRVHLKDQASHTIHYGYIEDDDEVVDEVLVMLMRGPKSLRRKIQWKSTAMAVFTLCAVCWRRF